MKKKVIAIMIGLAMAGLTACGGGASAPEASSSAPAEASAEASAEEEATDAAEEEVTEEAEVETEEAEAEPAAGFTEIPIWEDEEIAFMNVSGVYFQPVPMSNGNENYEDFDMHFEADVAALDNDLGYGLGDWIPYMNVDFEIIGSDGETAASGSFMPMSASDGPHYGANIALPEADTYSVRIIFNNPEENGYLIHLDDETGPGGSLSDYEWPLVLELEDVWDYVPQEW